jgi:hypothetical protein
MLQDILKSINHIIRHTPSIIIEFEYIMNFIWYITKTKIQPKIRLTKNITSEKFGFFYAWLSFEKSRSV